MLNRRTLRWSGLLAEGLDVLVELASDNSLAGLSVSPCTSGDAEFDSAMWKETISAAALRRSISRCARSHRDPEAQLQRVVNLWRTSKPRVPLLEEVRIDGQLAFIPGPLLFIDRIGCTTLEVAWEELSSRPYEELMGFEVEVSRFRSGHRENCGSFVPPEGPAARRFTIRRLLPSQYYHARVRALGLNQQWESCWSSEVSAKTKSAEAARADGQEVDGLNFMVPSERHIARAVSIESLPVFVDGVSEVLGEFGLTDKKAAEELLAARKYQGGWSEFVHFGEKFSRPPSTRRARMQRMCMVMASKELYNPAYTEGNPWCLGPFLYEEHGRKTLEAIERLA